MPVKVLSAEDSPGGVRFTQEAFSDVSCSAHLRRVSEGITVIARRERTHIHAARLDFCSRDLISGMDGGAVPIHVKNECPYSYRPLPGQRSVS
jgi:hypothetical protein